MRRLPLACSLCLLLCVCGGSEDEGFDLLAPCGDDAECSGGVCIFPVQAVTDVYYCSAECSDTRPCPSVDGVQLVCAHDSFHERVCSKPCAQGQVWKYMGGEIMERACVDGTPTLCSALSEEQARLHCAACGCAQGERCTAEGCAPAIATGDPCEQDDDCLSANCGIAESDTTATRRCLVAIGSACTADDCGTCSLHGQSVCTKPCTDDAYCPTGWFCIGKELGGGFMGSCRPGCYNGMPFGSDANCPIGLMCRLKEGASWCE